MSEFIKIGHRGAAGHEPENTLRSFVKAIRLGADAIELDVRRSADKIVVFHDDVVRPVSGGYFVVSSFRYAELRKCDIGNGEKIPTLEQVFGVLNRGNPWGWKPFFNVELKERGMIEDVVGLVQRYRLTDSVVISAFDIGETGHGDSSTWDDLFAIKRMEPELRIALLVKSQENFAIALDLAADQGKVFAVNPSKKIVTRKMVADAHKKGIKIFVWTVNRPSEIARIKALGVDGIFSDYPDRL